MTVAQASAKGEQNIMAPRRKKEEEGAPAWIVTYGDMMSLLLAFFIMLASLSVLRKEDDFKVITKMIQDGLGVKAGGGMIPVEMDPAMSLRERLEVVQLQTKKGPNTSHADDPGTDGRHNAMEIVRPGMMFVVGSRITFEPGSADLSDDGRRALRQVAEQIRGHNNKIIVAGHAASSEVSVESDYADLWQLSNARARAVMAYMVGKDLELRPERFRLEANADHEPLKHRVYNPDGQTLNRRVAVYESESLVEDYIQPEIER